MPYTSTTPSTLYSQTDFLDMNDRLIKVGDIICYGSDNHLELGVVKEIKLKNVGSKFSVSKIISLSCVTKGKKRTGDFSWVDGPANASLSVKNNVCYLGNIHEEKKWMPKVQEVIDYYYQVIGTIKENGK